ncbi:LOW QUALITY PROTEIN: hypothetical protein MAR_005877 [Mya arenaria]|uniref:Uncharacterized protein n=1 Tax=Mya arenaria TaxID=6604 RepID=A0ABY7F0Q2_MYAAR|nr:LOW QUALITY PROTEIN: hypothetical protein MAR_005877 [Mya arenaria]
MCIIDSKTRIAELEGCKSVCICYHCSAMYSGIEHDIHEDLRKDDQNFLYVWLVLLATRVWCTIRFFIREVPDSGNVSGEMDKVDSILILIQAVGYSSQAFCNCISFCLLDNVVRTRLIQRMRCKTTSTDRTFNNQSINSRDISGVVHIDNVNNHRDTQESEPLIRSNASFTGYSGIRRSIADAFQIYRVVEGRVDSFVT